MDTLIIFLPFKTIHNLLIINSEYNKFIDNLLVYHPITKRKSTLFYVSYTGIPKLVKFMIDQCINDWGDGLDGAYLGGHMTIIMDIVHTKIYAKNPE